MTCEKFRRAMNPPSPNDDLFLNQEKYQEHCDNCLVCSTCINLDLLRDTGTIDDDALPEMTMLSEGYKAWREKEAKEKEENSSSGRAKKLGLHVLKDKFEPPK